MPGDLLTYDCFDKGNVSGIGCPVEVKLLPKANAERKDASVMHKVLPNRKNPCLVFFTNKQGTDKC